MLCSLLYLVRSRVTTCREVVHSRERIMLLADVALPLDGALYPRRGWVWAASRSSRVLGLGLLLIVWSELLARIILYVIMSSQSSVSFVHAEDITRLRSACSLMFHSLACLRVHELSWLFVYSDLDRSIGSVDTCPHLKLLWLGSLFFLNLRPFFEMVCSTIYAVTSVLTQRELDAHYATFNIPMDLRSELHGRDAVIKDSLAGKIGMYTRFIEFANFRVPLSKFLLCVLEYYQIHLSQLSVIDVLKDPLPIDDDVDLICMELLNDNRIVIRKYPEAFLCVIEMGLLDFVKSADPFKVKVGERSLAENERMKRVAYVSGSPPMKKARAEGVVIPQSRPATVGKSPTALQRLFKQSGQTDIGSGSATAAMEDFVSSFATPTPLQDYEDDSGHGDNVRTCHPSGRFIVLSSGSTDTDIAASPQVVSPIPSVPAIANSSAVEPVVETRGSFIPETEVGMPSISENETRTLSTTPGQSSPVDDFYKSHTIDSATAQNIYAPNWGVTNDAWIENPAVCQNFLDHVTHPGYWADLHNQNDVGFLNSFNINSAQHVCMRDVEITDLKAKLEKTEREATEVVMLRGHVSELEAGLAANSGEVVVLNGRNSELLGKVSSLESTHEELDSQVSKLKVDCEV
ncbi:hypothetical protein Tco_1371739, partial [Tanacetum coccineum]